MMNGFRIILSVVGLVTTYLHFVKTQGVVPGKSLAANITFVWFYSGMKFDVLLEVVIP